MAHQAKNLEYTAVFSPNEQGGYSVSFPDFPGCVTFGKNLNEAKEKAAEVLTVWLEEMQEAGEEIPRRSRQPIIDEIRIAYSGAA